VLSEEDRLENGLLLWRESHEPAIGGILLRLALRRPHPVEERHHVSVGDLILTGEVGSRGRGTNTHIASFFDRCALWTARVEPFFSCGSKPIA
jgi:hypothetical protein